MKVYQKKEITDRKCVECGGVFSAKRSDAAYCSRKCSEIKRKSKTHIKNCKECGIEFISKRSDAVYCSHKCGARVHARQSYQSLSKEARKNIYQSRKEYGAQYVRKVGISKRKNCQLCGNEFCPSAINRTTYCSERCYQKVRYHQQHKTEKAIKTQLNYKRRATKELLPSYVKKVLNGEGIPYALIPDVLVRLKTKQLKLKRYAKTADESTRARADHR